MSATDTNLNATLEAERLRQAEQRELEDREPATLERDIDATRADVHATLRTLERRLSFDRLVEMTVGRIRDRGGEFAGNLTETATQNPVPVLLTAIGVGWMMLTSRRSGNGVEASLDRARSGAADMAERASGAADRVGERLHEAVDSSREMLGARAESVRDGASRAAAATREQVDYARESFGRLLEEQPLMLGVLGLAAGAIMGALLPTTDAEGRMLGEVRDSAVETMKSATRKRYEAARESVASHLAPENRGDATSERASRPH